MNMLIPLDFVPPRHRVSWLGGGLLILGVITAAAVGLDYRAVLAQRAALELRLAAAVIAHSGAAADGALRARAAGSTEFAVRELATPWTALLAELERVSQDSRGDVAVLGVEPDHAKHSVHIVAEARSLALAIAYVQRLQGSPLLRYPMLDSHEVRSDDPERPVRFELSSEWRDAL